MNINYQLSLLPPLPTVYGPKDYRDFRDQLKQVNRILDKTNLEYELIENDLKKNNINNVSSRHIDIRRKMLRCSIIKTLSGLKYRKLAVRLADSELYQWFTLYNVLGPKKTPAKSSLERFYKHFDQEQIRTIIDSLNKKIASKENAQELLNKEEEIKMDNIFADSTCLKTPIHFPVDWVLLRDAVRTLSKAIICIRKKGLIHRIPDPESFMTSINKLCIEMSNSRRKKNAKKKRKATLRKMKMLVKIIQKHGERYHERLLNDWELTSWSFAQAKCVLNRIENVLEKLPEAKRQAHERIIGERPVNSGDKLLSLYEDDIHVIVRGKSGAEVEFGNGFYLAEQEDGLIVDWKLFKDQPPHDSKIVIPSIERIKEKFGTPESFTGDRGFWKEKNNEQFKEDNIFNGICPKSPKELKERQSSDKFIALQKRRAQTEGRIGIFKNVYLKNPLQCKGFKNRELTVTMSVLTHNLWLLGGIAKKEAEKREKEKLKKVA